MTPKQARFVQEYLTDGNATQAAIRAGYSAKTAEQIGHQLLKKTSVAEAVSAAQAKIAERLEITAEKLVADVADICKRAKEDGKYDAALKANDMLGRSIGKGNPFADQPQKVEAEVEIKGAQSIDEIARHTAFLFAAAQRGKRKQPDSPALQ